jgi:hypothetical protein
MRCDILPEILVLASIQNIDSSFRTSGSPFTEMKKLSVFRSSLAFCSSVHLVLFFAAIVWLMPAGSIVRIIDQLNETLEFIFSPVPFENYYMLYDIVAEKNAVQLISIFIITAIPSYVIGQSLFLRFKNKRIQ